MTFWKSNESLHLVPDALSDPKATQEIFRLLVGAVEEYAIFAMALDGTILTWNAGAQRLKGYAPDEVIGTNFRRFYTKPDTDRNHPENELRLAIQNGKYEEEGWRVKKDGTTFWANVVITALKDENGVVRGFGKVTRDLTQKRQAELTIKESEERFRLLVSNVTDYAIITLDSEGLITSWNTGAERIKGYRSKEIIGKHVSTFYPRSEAVSGKAEMELRIATEEGRYEEEGWRVRKDGTMFWANVSLTAIRSETGELKGFAKVTRDLTARRQSEEALRQSQERYRLLVDNIKDYSILFLDPKGRITSWNAGAAKITGYSAKEVLGAHVSKFYTKEDLAARRLENELRIATNVGRYEEEGKRVRKDGTVYWANVVLTSVKDDQGNLLGFSKVTRDLTEKKKAEDALKAAYADLEKRIEERTRELSEAKARAESAVKIRDNFFSMASHELKTPLSSLKMQIQLRKRSVKRGKLDEFAPENLLNLCNEDERQVNRLSFLVDNMLDISKLTAEALKLVYEKHALGDIVRDVVSRLQPILLESGNEISLKVMEPIEGCWDRHRLEQVFTNLLSNTGKYAPGKPVEIEVAMELGKAKVSVRDYGRGISPADQQRIFNPYERVSDHGQTSGLGLGLYITRQIIEAHQGEFSVQSALGEGSTFTVRLPLDSSKAST